MSNLINTGSKNIPSSQLVEGKKYQLVFISEGQEYPQVQAFFRGRNGTNLRWEHTNSRSGSAETKTLPANSLVYRNVAGGSHRGSRRGSSSRKNKRNTMRR